jgi:aryl-alcohol dehydrogenase-like predicted oxidoreductase
VDQKVGTVVWSPLAAGALTGKVRRGQNAPEGTRLSQLGMSRAGDLEKLYVIVDALEQVAGEVERSMAQVALNWALQRPTVASVLIGARNEAQLRDNLGAIGWCLSESQTARLDAASETKPIYPYWHQRNFPQLNPAPVAVPQKGWS